MVGSSDATESRAAVSEETLQEGTSVSCRLSLPGRENQPRESNRASGQQASGA